MNVILLDTDKLEFFIQLFLEAKLILSFIKCTDELLFKGHRMNAF